MGHGTQRLSDARVGVSVLNDISVADMLRPLVQAGVKRKYGVDLNEG